MYRYIYKKCKVWILLSWLIFLKLWYSRITMRTTTMMATTMATTMTTTNEACINNQLLNVRIDISTKFPCKSVCKLRCCCMRTTGAAGYLFNSLDFSEWKTCACSVINRAARIAISKGYKVWIYSPQKKSCDQHYELKTSSRFNVCFTRFPFSYIILLSIYFFQDYTALRKGAGEILSYHRLLDRHFMLFFIRSGKNRQASNIGEFNPQHSRTDNGDHPCTRSVTIIVCNANKVIRLAGTLRVEEPIPLCWSYSEWYDQWYPINS